MTKYRGADYPINRTLTTDGTTPIQITSLDALIIYVIHRYTRQILSKYQYPLTAGYDTIEIVDDIGGQIRFRFQSAETSVMATGLIDIEYMIRLADANYDDSEYDQVATEQYDLFKDTVIKTE